MNPFPNAPGVTDIGDGRKMVETHDRGHCIRMIEPNGSVSMVISLDTPRPTQPAPTSDKLFYVRHTGSGQEIVSADGEIIATTTDEKHAKHINTLLIVWENMKKQQAGA